MAVGRGSAYYVVSITITDRAGPGGQHVLRRPARPGQPRRQGPLPPHLFTLRGDRQVFSNGIVVLAVMAGALLVAVGGNTNTLIPLFAIGVFMGFTLSQTGLVVHWRRTRPPGWRRRAVINGLGALITAIATVVFLVSKFTEGAWVVVVAVPAFVFLFLRIHAYYERAGDLRSTRSRRSRSASGPSSSCRSTGCPASPSTPCARPVAGAGGMRRDRRRTAGTRAAETPTTSGDSGERGTRGCRCTCCTPSTPRSSSRSSA